MSLLNIALVTIKQRVREIGIRRSFGATTSRVFFSVMMESVVATFVAGLVGVIGAVGIVNSPLIADHVITNVTDIPPFPISAAVLGLVVSLAVGSLAGLLPAAHRRPGQDHRRHPVLTLECVCVTIAQSDPTSLPARSG